MLIPLNELIWMLLKFYLKYNWILYFYNFVKILLEIELQIVGYKFHLKKKLWLIAWKKNIDKMWWKYNICNLIQISI